jgi:hypothetical protein
MDAQINAHTPANAGLSIEAKLRVLREVVAATLALVIVGVTGVMLYIIFSRFIGPSDPAADKQFERAKDILLFMNPLVGVVIGYYFNKVSTEARAEKAEATVASANTNAQLAISDRNEAKAEAKEAKAVLNEVMPAAQEILNEGATRSPGTLGGAENAAADSNARRTLRAALDRWQRSS